MANVDSTLPTKFDSNQSKKRAFFIPCSSLEIKNYFQMISDSDHEENLVTSFGNFTLSSNHSRKVMILIDDSKESKNALEKAIKNGFIKDNDSIILIHARQPSVYNPSLFLFEEYDNEAPFILATRDEFEPMNQALLESSISLLKRAATLIEKSGKYQNVKAYSVSSYTPRDELLDQVRLKSPDLVIVGARSNQKSIGEMVQEFFVGSVSNYLVNNSQIPLLIIRPDGQQV